MEEKTTPKSVEKAKVTELEVPSKVVDPIEPPSQVIEVVETKPEPIVIKAEPVAPITVEEPKDEPKDELQSAKLFSLKTDTYHAWVTQNGDKKFQANLEVASGSAYNWPATSATEAEDLLKYHITNQKL